MTAKFWITWVLFSGLLWNLNVSQGKGNDNNKKCLMKKTIWIFADTFDSIFNISKPENQNEQNNNKDLKDGDEQNNNNDLKDGACAVFLNLTANVNKMLELPQHNILHVIRGNSCLSALCNRKEPDPRIPDSSDIFEVGNCTDRRIITREICKPTDLNETPCKDKGEGKDTFYTLNITATNSSCYKCKKLVKKPNVKLEVITSSTAGEAVNSEKAGEIINNVKDIVPSLNESSASFSGEGMQGAIVIERDSEDGVYFEEAIFAYGSSDDSLSIIGDSRLVPDFSRTVRVPKEAFGQALSLNVSVPFAAVLKFTNMAQDEKQSIVLQNEVLAVEMGTAISNLTDHIEIDYRNMDYKGIPSCQSWDGKGQQPNWTDEGCQTIINGTNISCQCSHLTFFAILLTPLNETISSSDLDKLTIITNVGCGLSMFFLCIVLFMHFLLRRTKATDTTKILIHLVVSMFLLNFTFMINNYVANLKSSLGCKIMAALMHYFLLATFTWFAVQALHLCLHVYKGGRIVIHRYMLKVCILSWAIPSVIALFLLGFNKYGEQVIHTDNAVKDVTMCWITDGNTHYIVNIGYYAIVFLFTFTTFTIMLSWLCCLKKTKADNKQAKENGISIMTIMGLCCMLGITWGFAFFAYGDLRIPSYYIFTALNSFQGFFLFIYYYRNRNKVGMDTNMSSDSTNASKTTSIGTDLHVYDNPYSNQLEKKYP